MEEIILQNPGVVPSPKDGFGKRASAKLGFKMKINNIHWQAELANLMTVDFLKKWRT